MTSEKEIRQTLRKIMEISNEDVCNKIDCLICPKQLAILSSFAKQQRREGAIEKLEEIIASNRMITAKYLYEIEVELEAEGKREG